MKITILSMLTGDFDPYWRDVEMGVHNAEGNLDVELECLVYNKPGGGEKDITAWQHAMISDIVRKRDTMALGAAMLDFASAGAAIRKVINAGIPMITFDTDAPDSGRAFFIGTNNYTAGSTCGFNMAKKVDFKGNIVIDAPSMGVQSCMERMRGFKDVIKRYPDVHIALELSGGESHALMEAQAEKTLQTVKDLKGIFCISGTSAKVNAKAVKKAGLAGKVKIISFDADRDIIHLLQEGVIDSTVAQRPYTMGYRVVDYLYRIGQLGVDTVMKSIPQNRIVDTGIHIVTRENIDTYRESLKRLGIPVEF
jgi:ribose transport system substrate-binding protein